MSIVRHSIQIKFNFVWFCICDISLMILYLCLSVFIKRTAPHLHFACTYQIALPFKWMQWTQRVSKPHSQLRDITSKTSWDACWKWPLRSNKSYQNSAKSLNNSLRQPQCTTLLANSWVVQASCREWMEWNCFKISTPVSSISWPAVTMEHPWILSQILPSI